MQHFRSDYMGPSREGSEPVILLSSLFEWKNKVELHGQFFILQL